MGFAPGKFTHTILGERFLIFPFLLSTLAFKTLRSSRTALTVNTFQRSPFHAESPNISHLLFGCLTLSKWLVMAVRLLPEKLRAAENYFLASIAG